MKCEFPLDFYARGRADGLAGKPDKRHRRPENATMYHKGVACGMRLRRELIHHAFAQKLANAVT